MRQYIRQSRLSITKVEETNSEPVPKKAKLLPFLEYSCHGPIDCFTTTYIYFSLHLSNFSPTDNTLFYNQHNTVHSLQ